MANYFTYSQQEQRKLIEASALKMKVDPIIIEKDLWVIITLQALFANQINQYFEYEGIQYPKFIFKGGTSLSKGYNLIDRFSEDIDITIDRKYFGFDDSYTELFLKSQNQLSKWLSKLKKAAERYISVEMIPYLENTIKNLSNEEVVINTSRDDSLSLEIYYPSRIISTNSYIKQRIYVEFGIRGDCNPIDLKVTTSYLNQQIEALEDISSSVRILKPFRTFLEKTVLLHGIANREETKDRMSRHFYDLYQLSKKGYLDEAVNNLNILDDVIANTSILFNRKGATYSTIKQNGFTLISEDSINNIEADYKEMRLMIFGDYPDFNIILEEIKNIEQKLNQKIMNF